MIKKTIQILAILLILTVILFSIPPEFERIGDFSITTYRGRTNRNTNIIADNQRLFYLSWYGLEVYEIAATGELILTDRLPITDAETMNICNDYIYVGTLVKHGLNNAKIYKINVSDHYNLAIEQVLDLGDNITAVFIIHIVNNHLLLHTFSNPETYPLFNLDLELVTEQPISTPPTLVFGDNLVLSASESGEGLIHDFSDLNNIIQIGFGSIAEAHQYGVLDEYAYQDSILIFYNMNEMSFWDVSQPDNWQLLHNINIDDNDLMITGEGLEIIDDTILYLNHKYLVKMNLSDYSYTEVLETPNHYGIGIGYSSSDNNLFVTTSYYGIQRFVIGNEYEFCESIGEEKYNDSQYLSGQYMFVGSGYQCLDGIVVYDVSNPHQIHEINRFEGENPLYFRIIDDLLCLYRYPREEHMSIEIYDVSDPRSPELRNIIDILPWAQPDVLLINTQTEQNFLYLSLINPRRLLKFSIANQGVSDLLFDFPIPNGSIVVDNDLMYILTPRSNSSWYDLHIYEGLVNDFPVLLNTLEYFVTYPDYYFIKKIGNYLALYDSWPGNGITRFYNLNDPYNPSFEFQINNSGVPYINNDLLFLSYGSIVFLYDTSNEPSGVLYPISYLINTVWAYHSLFFQELEDEIFVYCSSLSNIAVYKTNIDSDMEESFLKPIIGIHLNQNYPNPFNPETIIDFTLKKSDRVVLEVFNIKGQRVSLILDKVLPDGKHTVVWNPLNQKGQELPSGLYLYRLKTGDYQRTRKMLYLK